MGGAVNTKIRYLRSKKIDDLIIFINSLPYKIEIKGNPVFANGKWFIYYILPRVSTKDRKCRGEI